MISREENRHSPGYWKVFSIAYLVNVVAVFVVVPESLSYLPTYKANTYVDFYNLLAHNLISGNGYRFYPDTAETLLRTPGYPLVLAAIFSVFGDNFAIVKMVNVAFAGLSAHLTGKIARRISKDRALAYLAPTIFLLHPGIILLETRGTFETIFIFLTVLFLFLIIKAETKKDYFVAGLVLGLACLMRSTPILFPVVLLVYLLWTSRKTKDTTISNLYNVILLIVAMMLVLSPWIFRNYTLVGRFVPTMTIAGIAAAGGQTICRNASIGEGYSKALQQAHKGLLELATSQARPHNGGHQCCGPFFYSTQDEIEFTDYLMKQVISEYIDSPGTFITCLAKNAIGIWVWGGGHNAVRFNIIAQVPLLFFFLVGIFAIYRYENSKATTIVGIYLLYYIAIHIPIVTTARMSIPILPFVIVFAAVGILKLWRMSTHKSVSTQ